MTRQYQALVKWIVCQCANKNCLTKGFTCCYKSRRLRCAKTVPESNVFNRFELSLSEKQIPRFVGNVSS